MKIRFIMQVHNDTPSGGRKIVYSYANYLVNHGYEVEIVFIADAPYRERRLNLLAMLKHELQYIQQEKKQKTVTWFTLDDRIELTAVRLLKDAFFNNDPSDVVVFTNFSFPLSYQEHVGSIRKNMFLLIQHDEAVYATKANVRLAWKLDINKIVISSWLFKAIKEYSDKVYLVKNYTETEHFFVTNKLTDRAPVVSMIYHPLPAKGTPDGLRALEIAKQHRPEITVILFGTPARPKDLPSQYEYYHCATIKQLREEIYNKSRIFVMPSIKEGWGLVATEAMACGAALVSTTNGGVNDFAHDGQTALLSAPHDPNKLADNILKLIDDPNFNVKIAEAGRKAVTSLTFKSSAEKFTQYITLGVDQKEN